MEFEVLGLILGILQGLFEWLPVSSEGQLVIVLSKIFGFDVETATSLALFSHIGTGLVVIIYYKYEFSLIFESSYNYIRKIIVKDELIEINEQGLILTKLIIITTLFTLPTALFTLFIFEELVLSLNQSFGVSISDLITIFIGLLLIVTGLILRLRTKIKFENLDNPDKKFEKLPFTNAIILGLIQGLAALPGISRSGSTITYLLVGTKLNQNEALRGGFLVAVPVSLGSGFLQVIRGKILISSQGIMSADGTILLINFSGAFIMIISAFLFGYLTLKFFLDISKRFSFDKFMIGFGIITILAVIIGYLI